MVSIGMYNIVLLVQMSYFYMQALSVNELKDRFFCQVNSTLVEVAELNTTSWLVHMRTPQYNL